MTRREFLEVGAAVAVLGSSLGMVACGDEDGVGSERAEMPEPDGEMLPDVTPEPDEDVTPEPDEDVTPEPEEPEGLPRRVLGGTGVELPVLGYGGAALAERFGNPLSHEARVALVRHAYDNGIRYFDTAHSFSYGESQEILGEALRDVRDEVFITSKVDFWNVRAPGGQLTEVDKDAVAGQVDEILAELGVEYLDALFIHGTPGLEQLTVELAMEVREALGEARDRGQVRFIGFSAHHYFDKALALIETGQFDMCMLAYGYIPRGYTRRYAPGTIEQRDACIARAHELGMGIVAMKVLGAGMLGGFEQDVRGSACRYVLRDERIHNLTIGMRFTDEIDANVATFIENTTWSDEDAQRLELAGAQVLSSEAYLNMPEG